MKKALFLLSICSLCFVVGGTTVKAADKDNKEPARGCGFLLAAPSTNLASFYKRIHTDLKTPLLDATRNYTGKLDAYVLISKPYFQSISKTVYFQEWFQGFFGVDVKSIEEVSDDKIRLEISAARRSLMEILQYFLDREEKNRARGLLPKEFEEAGLSVVSESL